MADGMAGRLRRSGIASQPCLQANTSAASRQARSGLRMGFLPQGRVMADNIHIVEQLDQRQLAQLHALYQTVWWAQGRTLEETQCGVAGWRGRSYVSG